MSSKVKYLSFLNDIVKIQQPFLKFLKHAEYHEQRPTLILDSSFNPPTIAHAALITQSIQLIKLQNQVKLSQVDLCFCLNNMDKKVSDLGVFNHRLELMEHFQNDLQNQLPPGINIDIGITNQGRFFDKAQCFKDQLLSNSFYFIMGLDTLVRFIDLTYYESEDHLKERLSHFFKDFQIILGWRQYENSPNAILTNQYLLPYLHLIHLLKIDPESLQSISSTSIRQSIQNEGDDWEEWVTPSVAEYIKQNHLYQ